MLNHLSWTSYFEGIAALLVIYYAFVGIHYYAANIRKLLTSTGRDTTGTPLTEQLMFEGEESRTGQLPEDASDDQGHYLNDDIQEADKLVSALKKQIAAASGASYAPAVLLTELKSIFQEHLFLKDSPHRAAINEMVVTECDCTDVAELTEDEVDQWWGD